MKVKIITFLSIIAISGLAVIYDLIKEPNLNSNFTEQYLPGIEFQTFSGENIDLKKLPEEIILLNFWASWCTPCIKEFPSMLKLVKESKGRIALVALSIDSRKEDAQKFLEKINYNPKENSNSYFAWDKNKETSLKLLTVKIPETYIINLDRKIIRKVTGAINWDNVSIL
jgi:cytochrome c biogenesis protein CcmG/thiol:disulfide interchange protein DsbE